MKCFLFMCVCLYKYKALCMSLVLAYTYNDGYSGVFNTLLLLSTCSFGVESCLDDTIQLYGHNK